MRRNELISPLGTQDYSPSSKIDGVRIIGMRRFKDDGGSFAEIARLSDGHVLDGNERLELPSLSQTDLDSDNSTFSIHQINHSYVKPGVVKAWHVHLQQEDLWFIPPGDRLIIGLHDLREKSPTVGSTMRFVLGDGDAQLLLIPRGVAHGCANRYDRDMQIIYFVNQTFSVTTPDEHRIDWNKLVPPGFWDLQNG